MHPVVHHPVLTKLSDLFDNTYFASQLASILASFSPHDGVCLRIDAVVCASDRPESNISKVATSNDKSLPLVWEDRQTS
jgi:hypothetical protein